MNQYPYLNLYQLKNSRKINSFLNLHLTMMIIKRRLRKKRLELTIGNIACFIKPHSDFVCDIIVRGILPKRHNGLESPIVYVLVTDNKFDFYNITEIADKKYHILDKALKRIIVRRVFTIYQFAHFLIKELEKD